MMSLALVLFGVIGYSRLPVREFPDVDQPIVSVAIKGVEFHLPVFVGDVVSFWTRLVRVGRTSITMHVDVKADRRGEVVQVTEAEVTYVAVDLNDEHRRPVPIRGGSAQ